MISKKLLPLFTVAVLGLLPTVDTEAAILQVNCAAGPFLTIGAAVAAAVNGDSIVVEDCGLPYVENIVISGFTGLHVVAASDGDIGARPAGVGVAVAPPVRIVGTAAGGPCIVVDLSSEIKIQNFQILACAAGGIRVRSSQDVLVLANRIVNVQGSAVSTVSSDRISVLSNLIALTGSAAILFEETNDSTAADNFIVRATPNGVRLAGGARNSVDNNDVRLSTVEGLVDGSSRARIERNSFIQSGGPDILINAAAVGADVIGNSVPGGINDLGAGTELLNNF